MSGVPEQTATFDADTVVETFSCATEENQVSPLRQGNVVELPAEGDVWLAGDIHDHRRNFEKFIKAADLANNPRRHIVLQELIHGDHYDATGCEDSWKMLHQAASLKCDYPGQVHFLMANHDLAQIHGEGIMKAGISVCEAFNAGVKRDFKAQRGVVQAAITEFLLSLPLAVKCPNGVFFCHSLPAENLVAAFDYGVFDRALTGEDLRRKTGPVYQLIWGRHTSGTAADVFAERVGAKLLVTGHQPQESGYLTNGDRHLIIASEHNQGVFLSVDLTQEYDLEKLVRSLRKFVAVDL
jgi:hypothetical protein